MRQAFFALLIAGYFLWPACQHPEILTPIEPEPIDTTHTLTCEDTIEINLSGTMEHGYLKAVKTCRAWKASGEAFESGVPANHLFTVGKTYFPHILTNGDTVLLYAEGLAFSFPKKVGKFPMISPPGLHPDTATCSFAYIDVDVFLAEWLVDISFAENELEVTELDLVNKRVKGRFNVRLTIDTSAPDYERYPTKLHFYDGEFDVEIVD
ncbi:MAG: hypothetical protein ACKVUS_19435 [Saprospiraceae bacterium]